jgi:hypothetical protein
MTETMYPIATYEQSLSYATSIAAKQPACHDDEKQRQQRGSDQTCHHQEPNHLALC